MKLGILGNGISRKNLEKEILECDEIWACNNGVYEVEKFHNIKRCYSVHLNLLEEFSQEDIVISNDIKLVGPKETEYCDKFQSYKGWSSGNQALLDALMLGYDDIHVFGFDFGGRDIYQNHPLEGSNFKNQYEAILKDEKLDARNKIQLIYPSKIEELSIIKEEFSTEYLTIDLEDQEVSDKELEKIIERISLQGGTLTGKGVSYRQDSVCGRLITLLLREPIVSTRDDTWLFYFQQSDLLSNRYYVPCREEDFSEYLKGKRVIFVGPSPMLENSGMGGFIDSFDIIVRTNNMINVLLDNPELKKDYGSRTDILYTNTTYEKNALKEWKVVNWRVSGLKFLVRKVKNFPEILLLNPWRRLGQGKFLSFLQGNPSLGVRLINDILDFPIKQLFVMGIDGYAGVPLEVLEEAREYVPGYLAPFHVKERQDNIGNVIVPHNRKLDSIKILKMGEEDKRLKLDREVEEKLKKVANEER